MSRSDRKDRVDYAVGAYDIEASNLRISDAIPAEAFHPEKMAEGRENSVYMNQVTHGYIPYKVMESSSRIGLTHGERVVWLLFSVYTCPSSARIEVIVTESIRE